jgi:hypothetical protein
MPKGFFTQCACVLLERPISRDDMEPLLSKFKVVGKMDGAADHWYFGGPSVTLEYDAEANGYLAVDLIDRPWPDAMSSDDPSQMLFGAWGMGHFGPFTFPHALQRSIDQSWAWEGGKTEAAKHQALIRLRMSYVFGVEEQSAPVLPPDYLPLPELDFVTDVAGALLAAPGAICYFNPGGETLFDRESLEGSRHHCKANALPSLDLWSNIRLFFPWAGWSLMDTVGMGQLDVSDHEACFLHESYKPAEVDSFLRNMSFYIVKNGPMITEGDTVSGPGGVKWRAHVKRDSLSDPPREVIRWLPGDGIEPPADLVKTLSRA